MFFKRNKLSAKQQDRLKMMKEDNVGFPFAATDYWKGIGNKFTQNFGAEGIGDPENAWYNTQFAQSPVQKAVYFQHAMWMFYNFVKDRDVFNFLQKVKVSSTRQTMTFDGITVSWDMLLSLEAFYSMYEVLGAKIFDEPIVVADLGAGWGRMGYYLKQINPLVTYVIFDIPESLIIASEHLPKLMDCKFVQYEEARTKPFVADGSVWLCGNRKLAEFDDKSIDVFLNYYSFQEMTKEQVNAYLRIVEQKAKTLFTAQYWKHEQLHNKAGTVLGLSEYDFRGEKTYIRNVCFSDKYFEAAFVL